MSLLVRERPPTQLSLSIETPGGSTYRLGADDPNPNNVPDGLSFNTTMPGGFDSGALTLERDPRINWPDLQELSTITAYGLGGSQVAYQARVEEFPSQAGSASNFTLTLAGWQNHLQDNSDAAMVYLDSDLTQWGGGTSARQVAVLADGFSPDSGSSSVLADPTGNPALDLTIAGTWDTGTEPLVEVWYPAPAGCEIAKLYYKVTFGGDNVTADANWKCVLALSADSVGTSFEQSSNLVATGTPSGLFTPTNPAAFAYAQWLYASSPAGIDNLQWDAYFEALQAIGNHGLTLYGSGPYTLLASDVIAHAVSNWAPKIAFTTGSSGTIQPSSFGIPQLVFTPTTVLAIIQQATEYELLDYAVWEATTGTTGPTLFVNARGARGRQWVSRVGPAQLQNAGPQVSRIYNGVVVQFTAYDGSTQTVGPPGSNTGAQSSDLLDSDPQNPATLAGLDRWYLLTMGTTTQAGAIQAGAFYLESMLAANTSGQASLVGHVQDYATGAWWPAWMVRAGDTIAFVDAADSSPRRIVSTSYDDTSRTNAIQLDTPADTMDALLDRLSASLAPLGLN